MAKTAGTPGEKKTENIKLRIGDFSEILGCTADGDKYIHLGALFIRLTACGKSLKDSILSREIEISCPECNKEMIYRYDHQEARQTPLGTVTYR